MNIEIERKLLISRPDTDMLVNLEGCIKYDIEQTYLSGQQGTTERVRKRTSEKGTEYFHTVKQRISSISRIENERLIDEQTYNELLLRNREGTVTLNKSRYAFPYEDHVVEIDVFPFWNETALLEVELSSEEEEFVLPDFINVISDVTTDVRYTNAALARVDREI